MRRTHGIVWTLAVCAMLAACSTGGAAVAPTPVPPTATAAGTRVSFVSTLVPRPTDPPTATAAPTTTPEPTATRAVNTVTTLPTPTPRPSVTPRPTSTPRAFTGAATSAATGGTREFVAPNAKFRLRYPEMWTAAPQGSTTFAFSPERGDPRIAGFLIEPVANPSKNPEQDLRDSLGDANNGTMQLTVTKEAFPATVDGAAGFRADVRVTLPAPTPTRGPNTPVSILAPPGTTATPAPMNTYVGSFLVVERGGTHYRIGVFARDGDTATLMLAEEVLASLRFT